MDNPRGRAQPQVSVMPTNASAELRGSQYKPSHADVEAAAGVASARIDLRDNYPELPSVSRSHSDKHIWVSIGVALGTFMLGSRCARLGIPRRPRNLLTFRMKLAGASAGLGTALFWEMGASEHYRRLDSDTNYARPWLVAMAVGEQSQAHFQEWKKTSYPCPERAASFERAYGPYVSSDAGIWKRCLETFRHFTHHMWSSDAAQTFSRVAGQEDCSYLEMLEALDVAHHDIDIWITSLSRGLEPRRSESKEEYASVFAAVALTARVLSSSPAPFLNLCLVLGLSAFALSGSFYRYQFYSYPSLLWDGEALFFALYNCELEVKRALKRRLQQSIEKLNAHVEKTTTKIEEMESDIRRLEEQLARETESESSSLVTTNDAGSDG